MFLYGSLWLWFFMVMVNVSLWLWFFMVLYGSLWFFMVLYGYGSLWLWFFMGECLWLFMVYGSLIGIYGSLFIGSLGDLLFGSC